MQVIQPVAPQLSENIQEFPQIHLFFTHQLLFVYS